MKNFKKMAAGSAIALVIGASALAGPMGAGSASADGHGGYFELTSQEPSSGIMWTDISLKRGVTSDIQLWEVIDNGESFRTLSP